MSEEMKNQVEEVIQAEKEKGGRGENRTVEEKLLHQLHWSGDFLRYQTEGRGGQRRVLAAIAHRDSMSQQELMEKLDVKAGSLSEILGKLESRGLITRRQNEEDRRNRDLSITPEGRQALEELKAQYRESAQGLFTSLDEAEKEQLSALLKKVLLDWKERKTPQQEGERPSHRKNGRHHTEGKHKRHHAEDGTKGNGSI